MDNSKTIRVYLPSIGWFLDATGSTSTDSTCLFASKQEALAAIAVSGIGNFVIQQLDGEMLGKPLWTLL